VAESFEHQDFVFGHHRDRCAGDTGRFEPALDEADGMQPRHPLLLLDIAQIGLRPSDPGDDQTQDQDEGLWESHRQILSSRFANVHVGRP